MTEKHLPIFGVGPYLISSIAFITLFALALDYLKIIPPYSINPIKPICYSWHHINYYWYCFLDIGSD